MEQTDIFEYEGKKYIKIADATDHCYNCCAQSLPGLCSKQTCSEDGYVLNEYKPEENTQTTDGLDFDVIREMNKKVKETEASKIHSQASFIVSHAIQEWKTKIKTAETAIQKFEYELLANDQPLKPEVFSEIVNICDAQQVYVVLNAVAMENTTGTSIAESQVLVFTLAAV